MDATVMQPAELEPSAPPPAQQAPAEPPRPEGATEPAARAVIPRVVIEARPGWRPIDLKEVWRFRDLLGFLAMRDVKVRYKQTVLGVAWAVIQPVSTMVVFYVFFGRLGNIRPDGNVPYVPWSFAAMIPWQLFANALSNASNSLVAEQRLISKVYFPRLIIPAAAVLAGLVDFAIAMALLLVMLPLFGIVPTWAVLTLPFFLLLAVVAALAVSLWLSALNVQYRDVRYTLTFLTQIWLFLTPVAYPSSKVPEAWRPLYGLNPMAGVVEGFRWALLGEGQPPPGPMLLVSTLVTVLLLVGGLFYFRRMEKTFADIV